MDSRLIRLCLILMVFFPAMVVAQPLPEEMADEIRHSAAEVQTLSSQFVQEKFLSMFAETLTSNGRFYYQRPDQLRWELTEPVGSGFVLNGDHGERWHERVDGSEPFRLEDDPAMSLIAEQLFAWARADLRWLQEHYQIELIGVEPICLRLTPPEGQGRAFLDHLLIQFSDSAAYVTEVEIHEHDGDYTRIRFSHTDVNAPLTGTLFTGREGL
ncbi:outer membrane lipoprotein carrier protein LolA [Desulfuromonas acetoxidans]|uniref:Outer membrane lipoprotein carrier protein LolA n=1 Tax=Desulfuromonas acetoxidans (strain DSM 684 / 11070) TaxID=281689 RepID=Q1K0Q3_DESA6|nr:outer membrane lipoprotein carrier protein LolA [Desulfuromonas acetoxidans]EAT15888.1 outer membrane lipoprotein carrier protein LolA [Desulfuromonas acetoxidans DSM 684]MBF0646858.1 outer membrane lipoprotein carrier protein LolA [Desulfuromonas acetoxidans]NVD24488.1 outer membrane lipoprotein carrier protein LolA [Desulfuromonas acetoxidans]NVE16563.1 outer membrane lipoprotein carrier protein LolA [Desulfuromonas acetoxidans]